MPNHHRRRIKTADRVFDIINLIQNENGAGVSKIAETLSLSKSTVHEYLYTLTDRGYLIKDGDTYQLSLRFFNHGRHARNRYSVLSYVQPSLNYLANETGEAVWFMVEEHNQVVYLENQLGDNAVQTHATLGSREHFHCTAGGKAILASKPDSVVSDIIEQHGLPERTENTITSPELLSEELATIRDQGYALNTEETTAGETAIAAPITRKDSGIFGSIAIAGPSRRIARKQEKEELSEKLLGEIEEIELRLNWKAPA